jgi:hypothetical protein
VPNDPQAPHDARSCGSFDLKVYQVAIAEPIGGNGLCLLRRCGRHECRAQLINVLGPFLPTWRETVSA